MRRFALLLPFALAFLVSSASATTTDPRLDTAASTIADHPVEVDCYTRGEPGDPYTVGAWGYVFIGGTVENMAAEVCDGALGIANHDATVPAWEQALGALVLTHESFHLNPHVKQPDSEARTECRAIRNFAATVALLGGSADTILALYPYALAIHYRMTTMFPEYSYRRCKVPIWWSP